MDFLIERNKLLGKLESLIIENSENRSFVSLKNILNWQDSIIMLNGELTNKVLENFDLDSNIGNEIILFEKYYRNPLNLIQSEELKKLVKYLINKNVKINFIGKAWSENVSTWIYFDTILNLSQIRTRLSLSENIIEHKNIHPRSGLEAGFIDKITKEGVMGNLKMIKRNGS